MTTAILINFNGGEKIVDLLKNLSKFKSIDKIILVDNDSSDESLELIEKLAKKEKKIELLKNKKNLGFAKAVNQGAKIAFANDAEKIILINPDLVVSDSEIAKLKKVRASVVSPVLSFERKGKVVLDFGGKINWWLGRTSHLEVENEDQLISPSHLYNQTKISYVSGACMLINKRAFMQAKGFNEKYFLYFEDVDFCLRVQKNGFAVKVYDKVVVSHKISEHRFIKNKWKTDRLIESNLTFINEWIPYPQKLIALFYWGLLLLKVKYFS